MTTRTILLTLLTACLILIGCNTKTKTVDSCGDGFVDPGEGCDGSIGEHTCASLGHYNQIGALVCTPLCKFDTSDCGGRCGDDDVDGADGEACDGGNLNGQTCESQGFTGGLLVCGATCAFDVSGCAGKCGNGVIDAEEGEICDGAMLAGETCQTQGYHGGALACAADCSGYNLDACTAVGRCGDGVLQETYGEVCDGGALAGETCQTQGYHGGQLQCVPDCGGYDLDNCEAVGRCGDGIIQGTFSEECEGEDLNGQTCVGLEYSPRSGALACTTGCLFDEGACVALSTNHDLATLTVSAGTLTPAFSPMTTSYTVMVPLSAGNLTVSATAADHPLATVSIAPVQPMVLVEGETLVTVTVMAEDGSSNPYTVLINVVLESPNIGRLISVPAGTFQRSGTSTNLSTVSAFHMSKHEITRAQWTAVTGWADPSNATYSSGNNDPVQQVSWYDAIAFCNKLSMMEGLTPVYAVSGVNFSTLTYAQIPTGVNTTWNAATANWSADGYRLPTEMEWMWAAMGADTGNPGVTNTTGYLKVFAGSTGSNAIGDYAVFGYSTSEVGRTTSQQSNPVGSKLANELGFHDLSGNVWEWIWDWYGTPSIGLLTDFRGPASGTDRVIRGGHWNQAASSCAVAARNYVQPASRGYYGGFRVVRR